MYEDNPLPPLEEEKKTNVWLIVGIAAIVLCCCCIVFTGLAWTYGDSVIDALNISL